MDSNLIDIMGGVLPINAALIFLVLHFWRPKKIWRFDYEEPVPALPQHSTEITNQIGAARPAGKFDGLVRVRSYKPGEVLRPVAFCDSVRFCASLGLPPIKLAMNEATTPAFRVVLPDGKVRPSPPGWDVPYLDNAVSRAAPIVAKPTPESARHDFNWLSAMRTGCFLAAVVFGLRLGVGPLQLMRIFWKTLVRMRLAIIAISFMLGLGYVTRYSGLDAVLGLAFFSQVVNGAVLPLVLIFMLLLIDKKDLMGEYVNRRLFNVSACATTVVMIVLTVGWFWTLRPG